VAVITQLLVSLGIFTFVVTNVAMYGKTHAALMWLQGQSPPVAWLSLTASQDDLRSFVAYFVAAIQQVAPGVCATPS
jgi:ATP/maltotriose-dependent transcriptional regulator MalT